MKQQSGRMHVDNASRQYVGKNGEQRVTRCFLLRRSYRDANGKPQKETLANISDLPDNAIAGLRLLLRGATLVEAESSLTVERSVPHGNVAAIHLMAKKLSMPSLLGPECRERDIAYALILSRAVRPKSKLSTVRWWNHGDTTLAADLGMSNVSTSDIYSAMDWLVMQQERIERKLAKRHLREGGIAMYDLSSSWVEGTKCELAAFGHSRDGKHGKMQIEYGLMTDPEGRPVGIKVFAGNTSDPESFKSAITKARTDFGLKELIFVGDRGMITKTRIADLRKLEGARWVTALKAPDIAALAADDGPLQMSLFDEQDFAEISHPDYPDERLVCCRNPALKSARARKRQELLEATEENLAKIAKSVKSGRLKDPDKIGLRVGKIINKHKVGKHFIWEIKDGIFEYRRDEEKIAAEATLDGIYVIRASILEENATAPELVQTYKNLKHVERDFRTIKADDIDVRPIYHFRTRRVESHMLICMLAAYLTWHLRKTLAPLTFTDQNIPASSNPVTPAGRSEEASRKDSTQRTKDDFPVYRYRDLLDHLATLSRQTVNFNGQRIEKITIPTPVQARAFELLGGPVPVALT
ncbi:MAG TPA: IS1634 family transposase [Streptosporangiaceae bacterium]|nr:IS1634 family transposase [Streptosporangiaceae bacterium]